MSEAGAPTVDQPQLFGHPRGLATLFLTEVGERFTYYGMRAILILFMVEAISKGGLGLDDRTANAVYGLYQASTYLLSLFGGWIADRLIGQQRAVFAGGLLIVLGNAMLTVVQPTVFFSGLTVIVAGRRTAEAERERSRRAAVPGRRRTTRRRLLDLLHGHQPRRVDRLVARADRRGRLRLVCWVRAAGHRDGARARPVPIDPTLPRRGRRYGTGPPCQLVAGGGVSRDRCGPRRARARRQDRAGSGRDLHRRELDHDRARRGLLRLFAVVRRPRSGGAKPRMGDGRVSRSLCDVLGRLRAGRRVVQSIRRALHGARCSRLAHACRRAAGGESAVHRRVRAGVRGALGESRPPDARAFRTGEVRSRVALHGRGLLDHVHGGRVCVAGPESGARHG